jgi:hypothetical protein
MHRLVGGKARDISCAGRKEMGMLSRSDLLCLHVLGFLVISLVPALAECTSPGFNPGGDFCNNCRYEAVLTVGRDQACERPYRPNGPAHAAILGNRVVQKAKHGIAGINGNVFAYQPSKGYAGSDDFTVEVNYRQGNETGKFFVHFAVTVH